MKAYRTSTWGQLCGCSNKDPGVDLNQRFKTYQVADHIIQRLTILGEIALIYKGYSAMGISPLVSTVC